MSTVIITRKVLNRHRVAPGERVLRYTYEYRVDDGPWIGYGTHLASLRDMLKRKFKGAAVVADWASR
jgi:hypothetical protein